MSSPMIVAGTGHRPNKLGGYSWESRNKVYRVAAEWLQVNRPSKVISGMALGWDQALALAAVRNDIPLVAAVPFREQPKAWPAASQAEYYDIIDEAEEIVYVCDPGYAPWKMQKRNEWMVDNSDTVLALWDGSDGGTGNCVKYAGKVNKPIINLWSEYERIR